MKWRVAIALAGLSLFLVEAWHSNGYYQSDEYFQTAEFASLKLGITPASAMAWEHAEQMRPFLQPAAYLAGLRALQTVGVTSPVSALLAFRIASALLNWTALLALWAALARRLPDPRGRTALLAAGLLTWYLPYLGVRTSSESVSGALLAIGIAGFLLLERRPRLAGLAAGLALGLAFDARYQVAFAVVGFGAWLVLVRRPGLPALLAFALGVALASTLGLALDRWGYGAWTLTPWNYLRVNLLEGRAAGMGTEPFYFYLLACAAAGPPLGALLVIAVLVFWRKARRDPLTWATVPFLLGHSLIAHKELRFLFPLGPLAAAMAALLWLDPTLRTGWLEKMRDRLRPALRILASLDLAYLTVLAVVPVRYDLTAQSKVREVADGSPGTRFFVMGRDPFVDEDARLPLTFLRPAGWAPEPVESWDSLEQRLAELHGTSWVVAPLDQGPPPELRSRFQVSLAAAAVPEAMAHFQTTRFTRKHLRGLWAIEP